MRVIAGAAKGTRLKAPKGADVRPTADRVKEALFSILAPRLEGALFLDLFSGSGAIGIEALSRGADRCIFVENSKSSIMLIRDNLVRTKMSEKARIITADARKAVKALAAENIRADLVFIDPPYNSLLITPVLSLICTGAILSKQGLLIIEHDYKDREWLKDYPDSRIKKYGDTALTFIYPGKS